MSEKDGNLWLGDVQTPVVADLINQYIQTVDLGSIVVHNHLSNTVGFKNVEMRLHVPNFSIIELPVDKVLGNTINLILKINLLTGKGTINVYNSKTNTVIHIQTEQIGEKIPYQVKEVHLDIGTGVLETDYTIPFVEIKTLVPDNEISLIKLNRVHLNTDYDYLKDGEQVEIQSHATEKEQKLIEQHVNNGFFIRK